MPELDSSNAFVGAKVKYRKEDYIVVKVNEKTIYLTQHERFIEFWENRNKGSKWKYYCERYGASMKKYGGITITDDEIARGKIFVEKKEKEKKKKRYLTSVEEREVSMRYSKFFLKGKSYQHPITAEKSKGITTVLLEAKKDGQVLMRKNSNYFFYDVLNDSYEFFKKMGSGKKELVWPVSNVA